MAGLGNEGKTNGGTDSHVITVASEWSFSMEPHFNERPTLLKPSAGNSSCCIFRAPHSLLQINAKAYEPQIVSIGPYHHGQERLKMIEQHKPRFFSALLERTRNTRYGLDDYFNAIASREMEIRDCFSQHLYMDSPTLVKMMVLDACFIVEVFRVYGKVIEPKSDDSFFATPWINIFLARDLLRIENQIPFFVLQEIFNLSRGDGAPEANQRERSLSELALQFFNNAAPRPLGQPEKFNEETTAKHLLDLFRLSLVGHSDMKEPGDVDGDYLELIPSASQLLRSGIKCKPRKGDNLNLLDIQFNRGVLQIPRLTLDDFMSCFLRNCIIFEQCFCPSCRHFTHYIIFMRCLVSKEADAELLFEKQVLLNYLGSHKQVATFFNTLGKDIAFDISKSYLAKLFGQVNRYHRSKWHVRLTMLRREYFGNPWSFMSVCVGAILFFAALIQLFLAYSSVYYNYK